MFLNPSKRKNSKQFLNRLLKELSFHSFVFSSPRSRFLYPWENFSIHWRPIEKGSMGSFTGDSWMKEYSEAAKLAEDINGMLSDKAASGPPGSDSQRHFSSARRKITILGTRLDSLEALLSKLPSKQPITDKELNRRKDMISNLRAKTKQMASALSMSNFARDSLLGPEIKPVDAMTRTAGLDNQGIVTLQRIIIKEQDDGLEKLEESVISTKHIALAVNEELELHTRLILCFIQFIVPMIGFLSLKKNPTEWISYDSPCCILFLIEDFTNMCVGHLGLPGGCYRIQATARGKEYWNSQQKNQG